MMEFNADGIKSFKGLTVGILQVMVKGMGEALQAVVDQLDDEIPHPGAGWESVGKRERRLSTLFGLEICIRRRGFRRRDRQGGEGDGQSELLFPLDRALGLAPGERFCPLVQHLAITLATELSFRGAAELLNSMFDVAISHQEVHRWVQEAGEEREREVAGQVAAAFVEGKEIPAGDRAVPVVVVEADGVWVRLQREKKRWLELKLGVMHEGWAAESPAGKRLELINKGCWGGNLTTEAFWERGVVELAGRYDLSQLERVLMNGDGAVWIKAGQEHLAPAELYLDPYHRNQALVRGLGHDRALLAEAQAALQAEDLERLDAILDRAVAAAGEPEVKERVREVRRYLKANWDGLGDYRKRPGPQPQGAKALGTMESQVRHIAAARMKRRGASWRPSGANSMVQLRLLGQMGKLHEWLEERGAQRWATGEQRDGRHEPSRVLERLSKTDTAAWLRAGVPLLQTKAGNTPLGRALKGLSRLRSPA